MNFNPSTNNNEGEILMRGAQAAAQYKMAGGQAMAAGIQSAAGSVAGGLATYQKSREEAKGADDFMDFMKAKSEEAGTPMSEEMLTKFSTANLAGKKKILGELTIDSMNKLKAAEQTQRLDLERYSIDKSDRLKRDQMAEEETRFGKTMEARNAPPKVVDVEGEKFIQQNGQLQRLRGAQSGVPDGTVATDEAGNEVGVYFGGKFQKDQIMTRWNPANGGQELINKRTGRPVGNGAAPDDAGGGLAPAQQQAAPAAAAVGAEPLVTTKAQFDALPQGAIYRLSNGRRATK